jgi:ribosomal protein L9
MKLTKEDFREVLKQTASEIINEALDEGNAKLAMDITLVGALFGAVLTKNLFNEKEEIEIIKE